MTTSDPKELEGLVLKESIVSATGLSPVRLQVGIKGDPSLRETAIDRPRYTSRVDTILPELTEALTTLVLERGTYKVHIGFNNAEVRTMSVFDPLREETHDAEKLIDEAYVNRHFPTIPYQEKISAIRDIYRFVREGESMNYLPEYWRNIVNRRHTTWRPMDPEEIKKIFSTLGTLRSTPDYYIRNMNLSIVQGLVRMQFNCDGAHFIRSQDFQQFLEDNLP